MDLKPIILGMAVLSSATTVSAQMNSKQSAGYAERAAMMLNDGNFRGCIDQCTAALALGSAEREHLNWLRAVASFKEGSPNCRQLLTAFIKEFPASSRMPSAKLMLATLTFYNADYAAALKELRQIKPDALQLDEVDDLTYRKAFCMIKLGELDGAMKLMQSLLSSTRYAGPAEFYIGYIYCVKGDYDAAVPLLQQADVSEMPGKLAPYYLTQIEFKRRNYAKALNSATDFISRADVDEEYRDEAERICGESLYALGRVPQALNALNTYIAKHPDDAPLSTKYIIGLDSYESGNYDEAIRLLAPVSELNDAMGQNASLTLGQSYMAQHKSANALMMLRRATELDFDPTVTEKAFYNYAVATIDGGRVPFNNSVQLLENFVKQYPQSNYATKVREYLVKGYMSTDDYHGAMRSLKSINQDNAAIREARQRVNFVLGTRALQSDKAAEAVGYLTDALKYASSNSDIARQTYLWLGDAYYAEGKYNLAEKQYIQFLKVAPSGDINRPMASYNLAYSLFAQKKYDEARSRFQGAIGAKNLPREVETDALNRIADTYYYSHDFDNALKIYQKAFDSQPRLGDYALMQSANMKGHKGLYAEKIATIKNMLHKFPSSPLRSQAMTEMAQAQSASGNQREAMETYRQIVKDFPSSAQGRNAKLQLAIIHRNLGETEDAKILYKELVKNHPTSNEAALAVQNLKIIYGQENDIESLNKFLISVKGAPQIDAVELNAIAASGLLGRAKAAENDVDRLTLAREFLEKYPDADGAEEALEIAACAEYNRGMADRALKLFSDLEAKASSSVVRHTARMGIIRSAEAMGDNARIIETSQNILASSAIAGADLPEVKFTRAKALAATNKTAEATKLWEELGKTPANIYGTRSLYELADAEFKAGKLKKAAQTAEKVIDANPPHQYWLARTYILYSDILRKQGSVFEANEYLKALRTNYPGNETDIFELIDKRLGK